MDDNTLKVLVNDEGQYSLWPDYLTVPAGWQDTGVSGSQDTCLSYVREAWTDMRPRSLRRQMEAAGG